MPKSPRLSSKELCKRLAKLGAVKLSDKRGKGAHAIYARKRDDGTVGRATVPMGNDTVTQGTLGSIVRALGLTKDDLSG